MIDVNRAGIYEIGMQARNPQAGQSINLQVSIENDRIGASLPAGWTPENWAYLSLAEIQVPAGPTSIRLEQLDNLNEASLEIKAIVLRKKEPLN